MSPDAIHTTDDHWSFPWWLFGILVSSPASVLVGFLAAVLLVWQRKRLQLWAWQIRGRFR